MPGIIQRGRVIILLALVMMLHAGHSLAESFGVLMTGDTEYYQIMHEAFVNELSDVLQQKGMDIVVMRPVPDPLSWINSARKLVVIGSALIVSYGAPGTCALLKETSELPVLFAGVYAPEKMQLNFSNASGVSSNVSVKYLITSLDRMKKIKNLGVIFNKYENDSVYQAIEIKGLTRSLDIETILININSDINEDKFKHLDALIITSCIACIREADSVTALADAHRIATGSLNWDVSGNGVILSIAANPYEQGRALSEIVRKVINGTAPKDIPIRQPVKIDIVVDLKEAEALGISVPEDVIESASKVIRSNK